jgi:hypothetical protein
MRWKKPPSSRPATRLGFRIEGLGIEDLGFRVSGLGFTPSSQAAAHLAREKPYPFFANG